MTSLTATNARSLTRTGPAHDPVPSVKSRIRALFYLVGEAERSTPAPATQTGRTTIRINGQWHALRGRTATFEQLLRLAYPQAPLAIPGAATMSFRRGVGVRSTGLLTPGDVIELADGLVINADATSAS